MLDQLSIGLLIILIVSVAFIGLAKAGVSGAGTLTIPIMAAILGSKPSVGFILPILLFADIIAVVYYKHSVLWNVIFKILPWTILGIITAVYVGKIMSDAQFTFLLSATIVLGIVITIWRDFYKKSTQIPTHWSFSVLIGFVAGFTSMIGNAAGPIITLYLLSVQLPKLKYVGTNAMIFFILNVIKVPMHIFMWGTITFTTVTDGLIFLPVVIVGMILGFKIIKIIPEKTFKLVLLLLTLLSAIMLLFKF